MNQLKTNDILKREMDLLLADIRREYENSGKKVSGKFADGLEVDYSMSQGKHTATLSGYVYLAGRAAGKRPPHAPILEWVKRKGIFSFRNEREASGIAYAIAKKIGEEGTNKAYHLKIYEKVLTPQRIQQIIDKISKINIIEFVEAIQAELRIITKNV